jgi:hypothetical protein
MPWLATPRSEPSCGRLEIDPTTELEQLARQLERG